jgi:hypothetical protein
MELIQIVLALLTIGKIIKMRIMMKNKDNISNFTSMIKKLAKPMKTFFIELL